jgi:ABC-type lipoprotein export system ATPase subunit
MLKDYAITPDLQRAFDQSLALVKSTLDGRRSVAAYVHGSFGSGKSHFMSVLSLMLSPDASTSRSRGRSRSCTRCG